jgi:hypothetical protein
VTNDTSQHLFATTLSDSTAQLLWSKKPKTTHCTDICKEQNCQNDGHKAKNHDTVNPYKNADRLSMMQMQILQKRTKSPTKHDQCSLL